MESGKVETMCRKCTASSNQPAVCLDKPMVIIMVIFMKTISVQKMRFEFKEVRDALEQGEELVLTFRNRPLARLLPFAMKTQSGHDPALSFGMAEVDLPPISNTEMDEAIYV